MALVYSTEQAVVNGPQFGNSPTTRIKANKNGGRLRVFQATYTTPAASPPAIADKIIWGKLPVKARIIGSLSRLAWSTGAASSTLNLGDSVSAARHLAATAVTTAGSATPSVAEASGATFETSDDSSNIGNNFGSTTDDCTLISVVAGAALGTSQTITLTVVYVLD